MKEVFENLGEKIRSWISLCVFWKLILNKSLCNKIIELIEFKKCGNVSIKDDNEYVWLLFLNFY